MIRYRKESDEVLYPLDDIVMLSRSDMDHLKRLALQNPRQRIRLCAHREPGDVLHEMFIVHTRGCYVRPHRHTGKAESMAVLEGIADVVLFDEQGAIERVFRIGEESGLVGNLYYRMDKPIFHTLLIRTDFLVFHEVTLGPFIREHTIFPTWAPDDKNPGCEGYLANLRGKVTDFKKRASS